MLLPGSALPGSAFFHQWAVRPPGPSAVEQARHALHAYQRCRRHMPRLTSIGWKPTPMQVCTRAVGAHMAVLARLAYSTAQGMCRGSMHTKQTRRALSETSLS